ncbi:methylated-DNA--[protein]-cysteine S-methyltransferase [Desulfosporosinus sp. PR]|uniref:DVU0298 family protein n=1 Tax=Candidatus Desulfosporosinus nitrosoreducens TaxID=3401928 RepID=UPI0027FCC9DD|nr:DVU0298 family protein [Desulfosporosinus sp. PR]MDQ7093104.1 methylated-DNA--[protein]-cysteine S-methyltransferase [Desulfosporosinus sp. PR]
MPTKRDVERTLENRDWEQLITWAKEDRNVVRQLVARIYVKDGIVFWRAVEALGVVTHALEQEEKNIAVELVRRYFWMLNEESGGTAWNSSEAISSIIAHCPESCGHFNWMLSDLLQDDSLREGALWGFCQIAQNAPHLVEPLEERINPYLSSKEPLLLGLAALIYTLMQSSQGVFPLYRETGPKWQVPETIAASLQNERSVIEIYQDGRFKKYPVSDLWNAPIISFWTEKVMIKDLEVEMTVASSAKGLCWLSLGPAEETTLRTWTSRCFPKAFVLRKREPNSQALQQVQEYLKGKRKVFTIPLHSVGTPFQRKVWAELCRIPYGETRNYGELAENVGNPKAQRAVGMANHRNPLGIVVPCHRVIGKDGSLTGYAGGLNIKQRLLELEGVLGSAEKNS